MADEPIATVIVVGPGTGSAIVSHFVGGGFRVITLARPAANVSTFEREIPDTHAPVCNVSDPAQVIDAVGNVRNRYGIASSPFHKAVGGGSGTFLEVDQQMLDRSMSWAC